MLKLVNLSKEISSKSEAHAAPATPPSWCGKMQKAANRGLNLPVETWGIQSIINLYLGEQEKKLSHQLGLKSGDFEDILEGGKKTS